MFAQELIMSNKQQDLFKYADEQHGFNRVKKQKCLDCDLAVIRLVYNDQTTIYEGSRTCENCRKSFKRKYVD